MVKIFFLQSGACIVADEELKDGKRLWKTPLFLDYQGIKLNFKSLFHYAKGNEFYVRNADILLEDEVDPKLLNHYIAASERFTAAKAGLVIADNMPPGQPPGPPRPPLIVNSKKPN